MGAQIDRRRRKKWRIVPIVLATVLVAFTLAGGTVYLATHGRDVAPGSSADVSVVPTQPKRTLPRSFIDRNTASKYVLLRNVTDGVDLYAKAADERCYPASLTKLMTALVAAEHAEADAEVTIGREVYLIDPESSRAYLSPGTRLTLEQLFQALLLPSGNDAAYSVAAYAGRRIAGDATLSEEAAIARFVTEMNAKAKELGCTGTHFINPDGIHDPQHYTTAADMMKIAERALATDLIARTVALPSVKTTFLSGQSVSWKNTNKLIRENSAYTYQGATGMKTGTTSEAGQCLIASAVRDGKTTIVVLMGAKEDSGRWEDASGLLDISFM